MAIEQAKVSELHLIFGPYASCLNIPGVTALNYTDEMEVTRRGANNFGNIGPIAITDGYQGINGSFTIEGAEGEDQLQAIVNGTPLADFKVDNPQKRYPFYIVSNAYEEDGITPIRGHFVNYAKLSGMPSQVGPDARTYNFQAKKSKRSRGKKIMAEVFNGAVSPVTVLTLGGTALQDDENNYALLVLRQTENTKTVTVLKKTTHYTETASAITLLSGLVATEKALVIYIKA
jgi:hypothetical protein